ncbi:MAG: YcxB family protein [Cellvibrionaceae bacterium]
MTETNSSDDENNYYILNREYFSECFDQTADTAPNPKRYLLAVMLAIFAAVLFIAETDVYIAWFMVCLSIVELLSIRYKRAWWITRQMLSRAAGSKVTIHIDAQGISTHSSHHQLSMPWSEITNIKATEKGFLVSHGSGNRYVSNSGLDEDAVTLLNTKAST